MCHAHPQFADFCGDWSFWANKAFVDFNFPVDLFLDYNPKPNKTPEENLTNRYLQIQKYHRHPMLILFDAAENGHEL